MNDLVAELCRLPGVTVDVDRAQGAAQVRADDRPIACVDLRNEQVMVRVLADRVARLQERFVSARPAPDGVVFDLSAADGRGEALAAIRWRATLERLVAQRSFASP